MTDRRSFHSLSPQLRAVLGSLTVSLEAELNRYRRNRGRLSLSDSEDVFADVDESSFDLNVLESAISLPAAKIQAADTQIRAEAASTPVVSPPPLPPNKRLLKNSSATSLVSEVTKVSQSTKSEDTARVEDDTVLSAYPLEQTTDGKKSNPVTDSALNPSSAIVRGSAHDDSLSESIVQSSATTSSEEAVIPQLNASSEGYLASSEKLIESLSEIPELPNPVDASIKKPKRKTVSLLAGASLGSLGLFAGLGASYLMSNPQFAQKLTEGWRSAPETTIAEKPQSTFDPPGPDLSANEFVELKIDNLGSLNMPQPGVNPALAPRAVESPASANGSPATNAAANTQASSQSADISAATNPQATVSQSSQPVTATQSAVIPTGVTYYVTVPFSTEQGLNTIRQTVEEAFVRQFASGNKIQLAAFDNPTSAQQFLEELAAQGLTGEVYGPTTE